MHPFRSYEEALALSEQDNQVNAPNKQPAGKRPGPKGVNTHAPNQSGNPGSKSQSPAPGYNDIAPHGTPKGTGKNKNRLH